MPTSGSSDGHTVAGALHMNRSGGSWTIHPCCTRKTSWTGPIVTVVDHRVQETRSKVARENFRYSFKQLGRI